MSMRLPAEGGIMKVLYVCDRCKKLHTVEASTLIAIRKKDNGDYGVRIIGIDEIPLTTWQNLLGNLPEQVTEQLKDGNR